MEQLWLMSPCRLLHITTTPCCAGSNTGSNVNTDSTASGTPNTAPLPNPWAPGGGAAGGGAAPAGLHAFSHSMPLHSTVDASSSNVPLPLHRAELFLLNPTLKRLDWLHHASCESHTRPAVGIWGLLLKRCCTGQQTGKACLMWLGRNATVMLIMLGVLLQKSYRMG